MSENVKLMLYSILTFISIMLHSSCNQQYGERASSYAHARIQRSGSNNYSGLASASDTITYPDNPAKLMAPDKPSVKTDDEDGRTSIVNYAKKYIGKPYRAYGKKTETGFDCSGFAGYVLNKYGVPLKGGSQSISKMGIPKEKDKLQPGDLVFFGRGKTINHVAIVSKNENGRLEIIHSTSHHGVRIDDVYASPYWRKRLLFGKDVLQVQ